MKNGVIIKAKSLLNLFTLSELLCNFASIFDSGNLNFYYK